MDSTHDANNDSVIPAADADGAGPAPVKELAAVDEGVCLYADFDDSGVFHERRIYGLAVEGLLAPVDASGDANERPEARVESPELLAPVDTSGDLNWLLTENLGAVRAPIASHGATGSAKTDDDSGNTLAGTNPEPGDGDRFAYFTRGWEAAGGVYAYGKRPIVCEHERTQ